MRGAKVLQESIFVVTTLNDFVPAKYLLRRIREIVNGALKVVRSALSGRRNSGVPRPTQAGQLRHALWANRAAQVGCVVRCGYVAPGLAPALHTGRHSGATREADNLFAAALDNSTRSQQRRDRCARRPGSFPGQ
jgi:hypothetical protein